MSSISISDSTITSVSSATARFQDSEEIQTQGAKNIVVSNIAQKAIPVFIEKTTEYGSYKGESLNGEIEGQGTMRYIDGSQYVGEWRNGMRHGSGKMKYANGDRYVGQWAEDVFHGKGTYTLSDGGFYEGEWDRDQKHGLGKLCLGFTYEGEFFQDKYHGFGRYTLNGEIFEGDWEHGHKKNGIRIDSQGNTYRLFLEEEGYGEDLVLNSKEFQDWLSGHHPPIYENLSIAESTS